MMNMSFLYKPHYGAAVIAVLSATEAILAAFDAPKPWLVAIDGSTRMRHRDHGSDTGVALSGKGAGGNHQKRAREARAGELEERVYFPGNARNHAGACRRVQRRPRCDRGLSARNVADHAGRQVKGRYSSQDHGLEGVQGSFRQSANGINAAIDEMAGRRTMDEVAVDDINKLVANAKRMASSTPGWMRTNMVAPMASWR